MHHPGEERGGGWVSFERILKALIKVGGGGGGGGGGGEQICNDFGGYIS